MNLDAKVAVIGAGCSGITAVKNLLQVGLKDVVCYEQNPWIGGNWKYTAEVGHSSVCTTTHIISSKKLSEYIDFPMPETYPDYPSHQQVLQYFESYVDHFGLQPYIRFNAKVNKIVQTDDYKWAISSNGKVDNYDYVLIANGHHSVPRHPEFSGEFKGKYMHSHAYKSNERFRDERVLVIGAGNSACDCAVEISRAAKQVDISIRTPQYIVPKFFLGKPSDTFNKNMLWIPRAIRNKLLRLALWFQLGNYEDYDLPNPKHGILEAHPTLNSELLYKIRHGKVKPRKAIEYIKDKIVTFSDGSKSEYDTIVAATGYKIETAFFEKSFLDYSDADRVPLYLRMFHPKHQSLIFIGLFQPQGAIWPASDLQSQLAANYIIGNYELPKNVNALAEQDSDAITKHFIKRKRHTIEVDYHEFARALKKAIPRNAKTIK